MKCLAIGALVVSLLAGLQLNTWFYFNDHTLYLVRGVKPEIECGLCDTEFKEYVEEQINNRWWLVREVRYHVARALMGTDCIKYAIVYYY